MKRAIVAVATAVQFILLLSASPVAVAQGKSADECAEEIGDVPASHRQERIMQCLLDASGGTVAQVAAPFKGGKWFCEANKGASCEDAREYDGTIGGVRYKQYDDGSGWVDAIAPASDAAPGLESRWRIACTRDAMTDKRTCSANLADLWLFASQSGRILVSVGDNHFPGSVTSIKVGAQRFDTSDRDGDFPQSAAIAGQMKDGRKLVTRYMKWPYRHWVDTERELYGAEAAIRLISWTAKNLK